MKSSVKSLVLVALTAGMAYASADTVAINDFSVGGGSVNVTLNGNLLQGGAGQVTGTLNGASFNTYCVELTQDFTFGQSYSDYTKVDGVTAWGAAKSSAIDHVLSFFSASNYPNNAATSVAAQAAFWEILEETSPTYDLTSGAFSITSDDSATQAAITSLNSQWSAMLAAPITVHADELASPSAQDFMDITPVPEPSSYAMILAGLAGVAVVSRRRFQRR